MLLDMISFIFIIGLITIILGSSLVLGFLISFLRNRVTRRYTKRCINRYIKR